MSEELIWNMSRSEYEQTKLAEVNLSYQTRGKFTGEYLEKEYHTFIGTIEQCKAKEIELKAQADAKYVEYSKASQIAGKKFREEWFDVRTQDMTENQKIFIQRIEYEFDISIENAFDYLEKFVDLIK